MRTHLQVGKGYAGFGEGLFYSPSIFRQKPAILHRLSLLFTETRNCALRRKCPPQHRDIREGQAESFTPACALLGLVVV